MKMAYRIVRCGTLALLACGAMASALSCAHTRTLDIRCSNGTLTLCETARPVVFGECELAITSQTVTVKWSKSTIGALGGAAIGAAATWLATGGVVP